jgi:predicted nucleotidyltransferase
MIDVSPEQMRIVLDILARRAPGREVRAFGSRVSGKSKPYSDLDLAVLGDEKMSIREAGLLREAFEDSDLPFRVDVLDWRAIPESFRKVIESGFEVIQRKDEKAGEI